MRRPKGFTLVEVIIALFILSIISVAALASFKQMIRAKELHRAHEAVLTSLSYAYSTVLNDLAQQVDAEAPVTFHERTITFARAWEGDEATSNLATIAYAWEGGQLTRDVTRGDDVTSQTLLKGVSHLQWQWLADDTWQDVSVPLPLEKKVRAFKLVFVDPIAGEIAWVFQCP